MSAAPVSARLREGAPALLRSIRRDPANYAGAQALVDALADIARSGETVFSGPRRPLSEAGGQLVSVVVCSIDGNKLARLESNLRWAFGKSPHEVVAIRDARSLCEGFNRGLATAKGAIVVTCHDDIEIVSPGLGATLEAALSEADLVGVAGASRVGGPAVLWSGHPHLHGAVNYPAPDGFRAGLYDFGSGMARGLAALDGVFMAARRDAAVAVGYDERTFDGFHFYDLDFSLRAQRAGLRLAVARDLVLVHESEGSFDAQWNLYAQRFLAKFPEFTQPKGDAHWYSAMVPDRAALLRFHAEVAGLAEAA